VAKSKRTPRLPRSVSEVLDGKRQYAAVHTKCEKFFKTWARDKRPKFRLVIGSPPYENRRFYGELNFKAKGEAFVKWMVEVTELALECVVDGGLVVWVLQGPTEDYHWSCTPAMLITDLKRADHHMRNACVFYRNGISGSGGPDWFRVDHEWCVCVQKGDGPLSYSDNTACGHVPKYAPGGKMSHRVPNGSRRSQWGSTSSKTSGSTRRPNGTRQEGGTRPSHVYADPRDTAAQAHAEAERAGKTGNPRKPNGSQELQSYTPPAIANPGSVRQQTYTAEDVAAILGFYGIGGIGDVLHMRVGGGFMGHPLSHENEAPYPINLPELYVRSFTAPEDLVCDPFGGGGTTAHACIEWHRRCITMDARLDQVALIHRRLQSVTPRLLPLPAPEALATFDPLKGKVQHVALDLLAGLYPTEGEE
jgi:hypothetical protein